MPGKIRRSTSRLVSCAFCWRHSLRRGAAPAQGAGSEKTRQTLIANARSFETRGRPDLALQVWQQVLFSDAKNAEALAGVARDYKLMGKNTEANAALDRLRAAYPNDPNIAKIAALQSAPAQDSALKSAGDLARSGNNEQAMQVYRRVYGDHPPDGDVALAYYQTPLRHRQRQAGGYRWPARADEAQFRRLALRHRARQDSHLRRQNPL